MNTKTHPPAKAFSLIELLLVLVCLGIVAMLVIPAVGTSHGDQLKSAARILASDIQYAQLASLSYPDDRRVIVVDTDSMKGYHVAAMSDPDQPLTHPTDGGAYQVRFGEGQAVSLAKVQFVALDLEETGRLSFGIYGQLEQEESARFTLGASGQTLQLDVNPTTGQVQIGQIK